MNFSELIETQGGGDPTAIPDDVLYGWLTSNRNDLINLAKLGVDKVPTSQLGKEVRRRCKASLMFLAGYFLWETNPFSEGWKPISESRITEESHGVMLRRLFVAKDDSKPMLEQSEFKTRVLLWPRGGLKSFCDIADVVQWILCFPQIRVWVQTAADDLAMGLLSELKGHFVAKADSPTLMQIFFPEFCVEEKNMGNQFEFICPVWAAKGLKRKEPTVYASSVASTAAGFHWDLISADDAVSDRNSENEEQCKKVSKAITLRKRTLVPKGYFNNIGTRYSDADHHGREIEINSVGNVEEERGPGWVLTINRTARSLILIGKAIEIKPEVAAKLETEGRPVTYQEAGPDGCTLLLPQYMDFPYLMEVLSLDESLFQGQMNQNPRPSADTTFDRPLLLKNTVPPHDMPERGVITHTWDFAFSSKKGRDYSTASSVLWKPDGTMFVHDLIRQRYKPDDLAKAVVEFAKKWKPMIIGIEKAAGSELIHSAIMMHARATGDPYVVNICARIDWFTPDNTKDAKKTRMGNLHSWFVHDRLKIANYLPHLQTTYDEFERCLLNSGHNDIPDVISQQPRYAPQMQIAAMDTPRDQQVVIDPQYNLLYGPYLTEDEMPADAFGRLGMGNPMQIIQEFLDPEPEFRAETPSNGMPSILGGGLYG